MRVAFATMEKIENRPANSVGSSRIRARWLIDHWPDAEEYMVGRKYNAMIFQKCYWEEMLVNFPGIKIFDICDPDWLEPRPVIESIEHCHLAVTSTEPLAVYLRKFTTKPVIHIPDRINLDEHKEIKKDHKDTPLSAVWFGYGQNQHYLIKTLDFLIDRGIALTVISNKAFDLPKGFEKLKLTNINYFYETLHEELIKHDFALLPSTDKHDLKGQFKSNNKLTTCWALGLPVVQEPDDLERLWPKQARIDESAQKIQLVKDRFDVKISVKQYQVILENLQAGMVPTHMMST